MKFLENKYTALYYKIIYKAKSRSKSLSYTEKHHILPKSLGGDNSSDNLIELTGREHFICHILLTKMTEGRAKHSMIHAAIGMKRARKYQDRYINSRLYETIKKEYAEISRQRNTGKSPSAEVRKKMSIAGKGRPKSDSHKEKISIANCGKSKGPMSIAHKEKISKSILGRSSPNKGNTYKLTADQKLKISEANKKRVYSQATKDKIAAGVRAANERRKLLEFIYV